MQVVVYYHTGLGATPVEQERFDAKNLNDARVILFERFQVETDCAEWNIRKSWIGDSHTEAHIYGYCKDEHVALVLERNGHTDYPTREWLR